MAKGWCLSEPTTISIADNVDCMRAQAAVRRSALSIGFAMTAAEEIVLAAAELASNLVRHAGGGTLTLKPLNGGDRSGIELQTLDQGPGIDDTEKAFEDGFTTVGSLGYGLGSVNRLMDEVEISSVPGRGTHVVCSRWVKAHGSGQVPWRWDIGAATRPCHNLRANGDAFIIRKWDGKALIGVIDGLGHGEAAEHAALEAQRYVDSHHDQPLDRVFAGASRACRGTRGVVMALARFESCKNLSFASVGNVDARIWSAGEPARLSVQRGVLASGDPKVHVQQIEWKESDVLVLHSDGVNSPWHWHDVRGIEFEPCDVLARNILRGFSTNGDDATVVVAKVKST